MSSTPVYLMSPPRRDWALQGRANFKSRHAADADAAGARREWARLADAIVDAGGEVVVMPPGDATLTGMIYTAEAGEYVGDGADCEYLLPNMAVQHRRGEADHIDEFVRTTLGLTTARIDVPWEGQGDAIRCGGPDTIIHTYGVGPEGRTEPEAYTRVADRIGGRHIQIAFRADPWFHGNTFLQFFTHRTETLMLVCPEALEPGEYDRLRNFVGDVEILELTREQSEGYDTNALQVDSTVLAPESMSDTARGGCRQLGIEVRTVELDELFSKGGGAPVCLTNRLWDFDVDELPDRVRWSINPDIEAHTDR